MPDHHPIGYGYCLIALLNAALLLFAGPAAGRLHADDAAKTAADHKTILRYDPIREAVVPIPATEIRPGYVYNHFSATSKRRVWSYVQADGTFWHAFGPGTTVEAPRFDLKVTRRELLQELDQTAPDLAKRVREGLRPIRFKLDEKGEWIEAGNSRVLSVFDADTGRRWEKHWTKYLPIRSLAGSRWAFRDGNYHPIATSRVVAHPSRSLTACCPDR